MRRPAAERLLREERGFTLVEVLVTMVMMITVMFALYSIFDMSLRVFSFGNDKVEAVENARLGLAKMERELRASYPVDKIRGQRHLFFSPGSPATPARPGEDEITFGNDLPQPPDPPNRYIADTSVAAPQADPGEEITYRLNSACPASGTEGVCTLQRMNNGVSSPVVEHVVPGGLSFTYLEGDLGPNDAANDPNGTRIAVVRVTLRINKDGREQTLTTDVDLRNRG